MLHFFMEHSGTKLILGRSANQYINNPDIFIGTMPVNYMSIKLHL